MRLLSVSVANFGPFRKPVSVDLDLHGLVHITGDNQESPRLGANGVGKSKLLDAIYWCLYGKTSRGLKGPSVRSWNAKGATSVKLVGEWADGAEHEIWRGANPNLLCIDGRDVQQLEVLETVGLWDDEFLHSIYFSQFEDKFINLKPAAQLELFSRIMDLGVWEAASERASKRVRDADKKDQELTNELARIEGHIEILTLTKEQAEDLATRWGKEHLAKVREAQKELSTAEEWCERLSGTSTLKSTVVSEKLVREAASKLTVIRADLQREESLRLKLTAMGRKCPECGQSVSLEHQRKVFAESTARTKSLTAQESGAETELKKAEQDLTREKKANEAKRENLSKVESAKTEVKNAAAKLQSVKAEKNPHTKQAESAAADLEESHLQAAKVQKELTKLRSEVDAVRFWVKGFRDLRLWVIDDSLAQLEVEVNGALHEVGLEGWSIEFDVERETKSGSVSRGFTVLIRSPEMDEAVPWEAWSGGESQRLVLASTIGVANLIRARRGVQTNIEFWDEPSTWLSEEGIEDMLAILESRASKQAVAIADHRALSYGNFTNTICVVKKAGGSHVR